MRVAPFTDAEVVKIVILGAEFKATAVCPGWIKVKGETIEGYVSYLYVTEDKEKVDKLLAEKKAAEAQPVTEVSRQAYDDCDGSGHGYYEITYSDGSVRYEEY